MASTNVRSAARQAEQPNETIHSLCAKVTGLAALLQMTHGFAGEAFRDMSDELQDEFLWACSRLATECKELALEIPIPGRAKAA